MIPDAMVIATMELPTDPTYQDCDQKRDQDQRKTAFFRAGPIIFPRPESPWKHPSDHSAAGDDQKDHSNRSQ